MADHPILFKPEMVRALLDGRKTQTRRIIKPQPPEGARYSGIHYASYEPNSFFFNTPKGPRKVRQMIDEGDRLWVKETWRAHAWHGDCVEIAYLAQRGKVGWSEQHEQIAYPNSDRNSFKYYAPKGPDFWRPSIFMPRWASRITLTVTDVRVERLQDISDADAIAEGIQPSEEFTDRYLTPDGNYAVPRVAFKRLWDSINAKPRAVKGADGKVRHYVSYPWDGEPRIETYRGKPHHIHPNPWVAAYTFDVIKGNIDRIGGAA